MDSRFIESFIAVVDQGSVAAAARRLRLTPTAVALRIRSLEEEIGAVLLVRSGRTMRPTRAGAAIIDKARGFVQDIRELRTLAAGELPVGELRIGAISTALLSVLPDVLSSLVRLYPKIEVYIVPGTSVDLYGRVADGDLDAALLVKPPFALPKVCEWQTLREESLVALTHSSRAGRKAHDLLATEPFIRYDRSHWGGQLAEDYLRRAGITARTRFELDSLEGIAALVSRDLGVSLVPDCSVAWPAGLSVTALPLPLPAEPRHIGMLWARGSARIHLVRIFLEQATAIQRRGGAVERSSAPMA
jgi:DNA-binding transcriptional LysR family regulator